MKTATIRQVQHDFRHLLAWVAEGETIEVTRNRRIVARIVPPPVKANIALPDFALRLQKNYPRGVKGKPLSDIVDEQRGLPA